MACSPMEKVGSPCGLGAKVQREECETLEGKARETGKFRAGGRKAIWESARLAREEGGVNFSIRADETSRL